MSQQHQPLTRAIAEQISNDIARLQELYSTIVNTPSRDQEITALEQNLSAALLNFAPDLISAWFVCKVEYEPMMGALATTFGRVQQILQTRSAHVAARAKTATLEVVK